MDKFCQNWVSQIYKWFHFSNSNKLQILCSAPTSPSDPIANVAWPRVAGDQEYYDIGSTVQAGTNPHGERLRFWNEMRAKINN